MLILLVLLVGLAWFVPVMWVAVGIFIVFWAVNKLADEKIASMATQHQSYGDNHTSSGDYDEELMVIRMVK